MLHTFLAQNRIELIDRCKAKVLLRPAHSTLRPDPKHGIAQFLDQLIETLRAEQESDGVESERISGAPGGGAATAESQVAVTAALHGRELQVRGFTIEEVVHDYGDLCQAVTELAGERGRPITVDEFHTLNRCLDNAIADAVREYARGRQERVACEADVVGERHGQFMAELRYLLHTVRLAYSAMHDGRVGPSGATSHLLERTLTAMENLLERADEEEAAAAKALRKQPS